ncbi:MAG: hypothetical protein GY835_25235 [bacterium]|nr:hypothetical protein [bacterium]
MFHWLTLDEVHSNMISGDELSVDHDELDEDLFGEFLLEHGFEMVATRELSDLPKDKDVVLLHTSNKNLFKRLKRWARRNEAMILYDPEGDCRGLDLLAVVIDSELVGSVTIPPTPTERFINSGLSYELIERTLTELQSQ